MAMFETAFAISCESGPQFFPLPCPASEQALEVKINSGHEISSALIVVDLCLVAAIERIAVLGERRIRVRRKITRVPSQIDVPGQHVFQSAAQAVGKIRSIRSRAAVELMREAHAANNIRPPFVFAAPQHVERSKLILIDIGVVCFDVAGIGRLQFAVGGWVPVPHEIGLKVLRERIIDETSKAHRRIRPRIGHRDGIQRWSQGIRSAGFKSHKGSQLEFFEGTCRAR